MFQPETAGGRPARNLISRAISEISKFQVWLVGPLHIYLWPACILTRSAARLLPVGTSYVCGRPQSIRNMC